MGFTELQKIDICRILGITRRSLDSQLIYYSAYITSEVIAEVDSQITRWKQGTVKGDVWFTATESNEGFNQSSVNSAASADPKKEIMILIGFESSSGLASNEFSYER